MDESTERAMAGQPGSGLLQGRAIMLARLPLLIAFGAFVSYAGYTTWLAARRQAEWQQHATYNVSFVMTQARVEAYRLHNELLRFQAGTGSSDALQLSFEVLANRAGVLSHGATFDSLRGSADSLAAIQSLKSFVTDAGPLIDAIDGPSARASADRMLAQMPALEATLAQTVGVNNQIAIRQISGAEADFQRALATLVWVLGGLGLCGVVLVVMLSWLHRTASTLRAQAATIRLQSSRFRAALDNMSEALCMVDAQQRPIVCNVAFVEMFGLAQRVVEHQANLAELFRAAQQVDRAPAEIVEAISKGQQHLQQIGVSGTFTAETPMRYIRVSHERTDEGGWVATYADLTEMRDVQARLAYIAKHDALTGLPNRLYFHEALERILRGRGRWENLLSVKCLDLDHFKDVNDTLGHPIGDALLIEVAERLRDVVVEPDLVARIGGDEFAILHFGTEEAIRTGDLARRVLQRLDDPCTPHGHCVRIGTSIGIAIAPTDGNDADLLIKNAELALYRAKNDGRGMFRFFSDDMARDLAEQRAIEDALRGALPRGELSLCYQPQLNLASGLITGFEALLRWRNPALGDVSPARFIPMAEKLGLICDFGKFVLREACRAARDWPAGMRVAVNLSPMQLTQAPIVDEVCDVLAETGLAAHRLELEVTETVLLQEDAQVLAAMHALRALGVRVALDDFGTGYASPGYLLRFPFDKVKVDRCFVDESRREARGVTIVRTIASLARELGMTTTAEGIETEQQLANMREARCTEVQGYLISAPVPLASVAALLRRNACAAA